MIPLKFESDAAARWQQQPVQHVRLLRITELSVSDHLAWTDLSAAASSDTIFAASWFTQSVLAHFDPDHFYRLFVVEDGNGRWDGVFVAARTPTLGRIPFRHLTNLLNANQFSGVPLVRPGREARFWEQLFAALDDEKLGCSAIRLAEMPEDHRVSRALIAICQLQNRSLETITRKQRAFWQPGLGLVNSALQHVSPKRLRRLTALERQLAEQHGPLDIAHVTGAEALERWLSEFLALELAGWKGRRGSALASDSQTAAHFQNIVRTGFANGSLRALSLRADGRPVAMTCYFLSGRNAFGFKMAYDEYFARFAPGIILSRHMMQLHDGMAGLHFDSCSAPDAEMINQLWPGRHRVSDYIVAIGALPEKSHFAAAMLARKIWHVAKYWKRLVAIASPF